jgi:ribosomal protein S21
VQVDLLIITGIILEIGNLIYKTIEGGILMIEARKKDRETTESLMRRFSRRIQQSGVLVQARKTRFRTDEKSKREKRQEALYKVKIRKEIDKFKKLGKFDEEALKNIKRKMSE